MKRLWLPAVLALIIHGFLLSLGREPSKPKPSVPPKTEPVILTFSQGGQASVNPHLSGEATPLPAEPSLAQEIPKVPRGKTSTKKKPLKVQDGNQQMSASSSAVSRNTAPVSQTPREVPGMQETDSERGRVGQTEDAGDGTGGETPRQPGPEGVQASTGAGSGHFMGKDPTYPLPSSIREATPAYRLNPSPEYPAVARRRGYEGTVLVEVLVSRDGRVKDLRVSRSSGYSVLDQAAMASIRGWLFEPASINGEKVEMWVKVPVRFDLK